MHSDQMHNYKRTTTGLKLKLTQFLLFLQEVYEEDARVHQKYQDPENTFYVRDSVTPQLYSSPKPESFDMYQTFSPFNAG